MEGAGGQVIDNVLHGRDWSDNVGEAAAFGAVTGGFAGAAGVGVRAFARRMAGAVEEAAPSAAASSEGASGMSCALSFSPDTSVATPSGEQAIGSLQVGDQVTAYDPATGTTSTQTVQHVWINHDDDLLDVTLATDAQQQAQASDGASKQQEVALASHGLRAPPADEHKSSGTSSSETIHTTAKHPWLTADRGWVKAGQLVVGEQVVREDGTLATITTLQDRPGAADYYNLTVSQLHTYAVGDGRYVVHNCDSAKLDAALGGTKGDGMQAHHIIPCECQKHPLLQASGTWEQDSARNGILLPSDGNAAAASDSVTHSGPHAKYTQYIRQLLTDEHSKLPAGFSANDADAAIDRVLDQGGSYLNMLGGYSPGIVLR